MQTPARLLTSAESCPALVLGLQVLLSLQASIAPASSTAQALLPSRDGAVPSRPSLSWPHSGPCDLPAMSGDTQLRDPGFLICAPPALGMQQPVAERDGQRADEEKQASWFLFALIPRAAQALHLFPLLASRAHLLVSAPCSLNSSPQPLP